MFRKEIHNFQVLPVKFAKHSSAYHELFIKEHNVRNQSADTPRGCTLFVLNIPPYASEESLRRIFSVCGAIDKVIFQRKPSPLYQRLKNISGFKVAYIVFKKVQALSNALKLSTLAPLSDPKNPITHGINKWARQYNDNIPDVKQMQEEINVFMAQYDKKVEDAKRQEQLAGEEDEEGWITVTKQGRKPGLSRKEVVDKHLKEKIEKGKKKKELRNFYTFQIRESKMKHLASLRQKFEEDKKKISALKQARKFKPF